MTAGSEDKVAAHLAATAKRGHNPIPDSITSIEKRAEYIRELAGDIDGEDNPEAKLGAAYLRGLMFRDTVRRAGIVPVDDMQNFIWDSEYWNQTEERGR